MLRLIVHAGFHKTGTTSIQKTLRKNRAALRPHARIILRPGMLPLCEAARAYSVTRSEFDIGLVKYEAAMLAANFPDTGTVLLSSEDLSGHMPGRRGLKTYDATPRLMAALHLAFSEARPGAEITLAFSTRQAEPWLTSCHVQHVRATRMRLTRKDYLRKFRKSADLNAVIDAVAERVPQAVVKRFALEDHTEDLGPITPLLDLIAVPENARASLSKIPPANTAPSDDTIGRMLDLNRSDLDDAAVKEAKRVLNKARF